mmetsp:Transcript_109055/g.170524  ORF Transcript_109055/g.170524 Transcript_109055/m.170524 type:complete len:236 (+) Transcript_109055:40-747(+)
MALGGAAVGAVEAASSAFSGLGPQLAANAVPNALDVIDDHNNGPNELEGTLEWIARGRHVLGMAQDAHMNPIMLRPMARTIQGAANLYSQAEKGKFDWDHHAISSDSFKWLTGGFTKDLAAKQRDIDEQIKVLQTYPWSSTPPQGSPPSATRWNKPAGKVAGSIASHADEVFQHPTHSQSTISNASAKTGSRPLTVQPAGCALPLLLSSLSPVTKKVSIREGPGNVKTRAMMGFL